MVTFWGIEIVGNTVYSIQELEEFYRDLLGTDMPLSRIFQIAEEIQRKYHDDGYLLTRVIIPAQNVSHGSYRVQVIRGVHQRRQARRRHRPRRQAYRAPTARARLVSAARSTMNLWSEQRAMVVKQYLVDYADVSARRLKTEGRGETQLLDTQIPTSAADRRVQVVNLQEGQ